MIKFELVQKEIVDPKLKGFALRLRGLAFDDSLVIKYNKTDIAEKLGVSTNTLRKYLKKLEELGIISDNKLSNDYFIENEIVHLSEDRMSLLKTIVNKGFTDDYGNYTKMELSSEKMYKQFCYYNDKKMYCSPKANEIFDDILIGTFANKEDEKKPVVFSF